MNNLFATWHRAGSDVVDHLMQAHGQLLGRPDTEGVLALVDAALLELALAGQLGPDADSGPQGLGSLCPSTGTSDLSAPG